MAEKTAPPPPPAHSTNAGRGVGDVVAGRYCITGVVGKGAMGAVFAAEHKATGQKVALKFMLLGDEDGQEFIVRFEQEAKVMAGLRSSNTIRIYDFGHTDDGALFMAMELLVGKPLDKHMRDLQREGHAMTEREASQVAVQMLRSLGEAHGLGLVHRDMKPGNVFLNDDGSGDTMVKVLDFGLARVNNSALTNVGRIMGTPAYMAPEQWQGSGVGPAADLYAVGCMLYAMVTGEPPYQAGDNVLSLMHKHCTEDIPDPREKARAQLSDGYVQIMQKAMAKKADERFADAKSMRASLEALLGGSWTTSSVNLAGTSQLTVDVANTANRTAFDNAVNPAELATVAADNASALRKLQKGQKNQAPPSEQATVAADVRLAGALSGQGNAAAKGPPWVVIGLVVLAIAGVGAFFALRGSGAGPAGAPAAPATAAAPVAAVSPAPAVAPAPGVAPAAVPAPVPTPAPTAAPAPIAAPALAEPAAAVPDPSSGSAGAAKAKSAKAPPAKKKATTLETVD